VIDGGNETGGSEKGRHPAGVGCRPKPRHETRLNQGDNMSLHSSERKGNPSFGPQSSGPARTSNADVESAPEPFPPVRVNVDGIPATMRPYAQFFPWRWCLNDDGHPTKVPKWFEKNLETGKFETYSIRANLPENWHPFEEVAGLVEANQKALRSSAWRSGSPRPTRSRSSTWITAGIGTRARLSRGPWRSSAGSTPTRRSARRGPG
jgi:hypothetical protein